MTALIFLALAQAPTDLPVAIVVSSRRDSTNAAPAVVEQLKTALGMQGIVATGDADSVARLTKLGAVDPKACDGSRLCLQKLAQLLQGVVIGVDVSRAGKLTAGHLEAVAFDRVESLAVDDITSDAKAWNQKSGEAATAFALKLKGPLATLNEARRKPNEPPPRTIIANELKSTPDLEPPREPKLVPEPPPVPPPVVATEAPKSNLGPVAYVTTAAAIIAVGGGILCLILGFIDRGNYFATLESPTGGLDRASSLTDRELMALASQSNTRIGIGGALVGVAAALGITSALLFMRE